MTNTVNDPQSDTFTAKVIQLIEQGEGDQAVEMIHLLGETKESVPVLRALVNNVVTIITHTRDRAHDLARALDLDRERARDLDLDLARVMSRDHELANPDLEPEAALASGLALTKAMAHASERVIDLAGALDHESTFNLNLDLAHAYIDVIRRVLNSDEQPAPNP